MKGILGADVFSILLLVFIILTGMLLINTNKEAVGIVHSASEFALPGVRLPVADSKGSVTPGKRKQVTISAKKEKGKVIYYVDEVPVAYRDLLPKIKKGRVESVKIRFDKDLPYGRYVRILDLCTQAGIHEIINVYTAGKP